MASLNYQRPTLAGVLPTYAACSVGGDVLQPNPNGFLHIKNASVASITVTIATPGMTKFGIPEPDVTVAIPAGSERMIGPMVNEFADPADQVVHVTYSGVTTLTVAAISH